MCFHDELSRKLCYDPQWFWFTGANFISSPLDSTKRKDWNLTEEGTECVNFNFLRMEDWRLYRKAKTVILLTIKAFD